MLVLTGCIRTDAVVDIDENGAVTVSGTIGISETAMILLDYGQKLEDVLGTSDYTVQYVDGGYGLDVYIAPRDPDSSGDFGILGSDGSMIDLTGGQSTVFEVRTPYPAKQVKGAAVSGITVTPATPAFTDVPGWCAVEAGWAVEKGVTKGTGDGSTFSPDTTCSRGEIVAFLYRAYAG